MRTSTKGYLYMLGIEPEAANALLKELYIDSTHFTNDIARARKQPTAFRSRREVREERQTARACGCAGGVKAGAAHAQRSCRPGCGRVCCSLKNTTELYQNHAHGHQSAQEKKGTKPPPRPQPQQRRMQRLCRLRLMTCPPLRQISAVGMPHPWLGHPRDCVLSPAGPLSLWCART